MIRSTLSPFLLSLRALARMAMKTRGTWINAARYLVSNPRLFLHKLIFRLRSLRALPKSCVLKRINGILFEFDFDYAPVMRKMFYRDYEMETVVAMKKVLRNGDTFIDVGANIGYLSAVGMGLVGKKGQVHSFEPVPEYLQRLRKLAAMNTEYHLVANQCALGEEEGTAPIAVTRLSNIGWNTMVPGFMNNETMKEMIRVPVGRLDRYIAERGLGRIALIKIDTEGFEYLVLKGLRHFLERAHDRPIIICEVAPAAYRLLGWRLSELSEYMRMFGYRAFDLIDRHAEIDITTLEETTNVVFKVSA